MNTIVIGNSARNVLPRAKGFSEWKNEYKFGPRNIQTEIKAEVHMQYLGGILKQAVLRPGQRVVQYFEENGYEYETYAIYDPSTNTITSNHFGCPNMCSHHIGSTCGVCGLKD